MQNTLLNIMYQKHKKGFVYYHLVEQLKVYSRTYYQKNLHMELNSVCGIKFNKHTKLYFAKTVFIILIKTQQDDFLYCLLFAMRKREKGGMKSSKYFLQSSDPSGNLFLIPCFPKSLCKSLMQTTNLGLPLYTFCQDCLKSPRINKIKMLTFLSVSHLLKLNIGPDI